MTTDGGRTERHVFLSPHYDDIAFSCGGSVALLARDGMQSEIIVLFGAGPAPGAELTPFAAENLRDWGLSAAEVIAARQAEERRAAEVLGASVSWLPFPDAIYRGDRYLNNEDLFGEPAADEDGLANALVTAVTGAERDADPNTTRFYAPLAVGGHVDHRHAFRAGVALARSGWDVWFYEDLPYALRPGLLDQRLASGSARFEPAATVAVESVWETKLAAILAYPSQLERTFSFAGIHGNRDEIAAVLDDYAGRVGSGESGERFWRLADAPDLI